MSQTKHEITSSTAGRRRNVFLGIIYETIVSQIIVLKNTAAVLFEPALLGWRHFSENYWHGKDLQNSQPSVVSPWISFRSEHSVVPANDASQQAVQPFKEMVFLFSPGFLNKLVHLWGDAQTLLVVQAHPDWTTPPQCFFSGFIGHRWSFSSLLES